MRTNKGLINSLLESGVLKTPNIIEAFESVDRKLFVPAEFSHEAYIDAPLSIGVGQTISQQWTVAFMLELLQAKKGDKILDIGSGSGWTTALLAYIVGKEGSVLGLERHEELMHLGSENLKNIGIKNAQIQKATESLGVKGEVFDAILVSASADEIPNELFLQLKIGARLVIPVQNSIYLFEKVSEDKVTHQEFKGFRFVPLVY
jgi:protein-L-isoaspartate(D-aspartate) O-methyltransferase